jgi:sec-independent protein translocase protein TatC
MSSEEKSDQKPSNRQMSFIDHLEELRWRIIKSLIAIVIGAIACFIFVKHILNFLTLPLHAVDPMPKLIFLSPTGMFMIEIMVVLVCGLVLALPFVVYQAYAFVVPGLYSHERKYIVPIIILTVVCFLAGAAFAYFSIIPFGLRFLLGLATPDITPQLAIGEYITFVTQMMLAFGIVFEMPVLALFLTKIGIMTPRFLRKSRRYAIVIITIVAAVVTPTVDAFSQIMMIIPMIILYEVSILLSAAVYKKKQAAQLQDAN